MLQLCNEGIMLGAFLLASLEQVAIMGVEPFRDADMHAGDGRGRRGGLC